MKISTTFNLKSILKNNEISQSNEKISLLEKQLEELKEQSQSQLESQNNEISQSNEKISLLEKQLEELEQERRSKLSELEGSQQGFVGPKNNN